MRYEDIEFNNDFKDIKKIYHIISKLQNNSNDIIKENNKIRIFFMSDIFNIRQSIELFTIKKQNLIFRN